MTASQEARDVTDTIGLRLEINLDTEPIAGTLQLPDEVPHPFSGWLGLTAVLEELRSRATKEDVDAQKQ